MTEPAPSTARRLLLLADAISDADPIAAYLIAWSALDHVVGILARVGGVRAQFSLRQNGTLRMRQVSGTKMPEIIPPRAEHERGVALHGLTATARDHLIRHPAVAALARRVPRLNGRPIAYDRRKQRLTGVLDVPATLDPRYPVWAAIDEDTLRGWLAGTQETSVGERLVAEIVAVLETIRRDLRVAVAPDDGEANTALARTALPLLTLLVNELLADD